MKKTLIALAMVIAASCSKSVNEEKPLKIENRSKMSLSANIDPQIYAAITTDENFLNLVSIDQEINEFTYVLHAPIHEIDIEGFRAEFGESDSKPEVAEAMEGLGVVNAYGLLNLFDEKKAAIEALVQNHHATTFDGLDAEAATKIFKDVYNEYLTVSYSTPNPCVAGYVTAEKICDRGFTIATAETFFAAAINSIWGTPVAGALTVAGGIGFAYMNHAVCMADAADAYKLCRELEQKWVVPIEMEDHWTLLRIPLTVLEEEGPIEPIN